MTLFKKVILRYIAFSYNKVVSYYCKLLLNVSFFHFLNLHYLIKQEQLLLFGHPPLHFLLALPLLNKGETVAVETEMFHHSRQFSKLLIHSDHDFESAGCSNYCFFSHIFSFVIPLILIQFCISIWQIYCFHFGQESMNFMRIWIL